MTDLALAANNTKVMKEMTLHCNGSEVGLRTIKQEELH